MTPRFIIEPLSKIHDRKQFQCGNEKIDAYFRTTVTQDTKRHYATCFVSREIETGRVAGFYTLSSNSIPLTDLPKDLASRLPRYPTVPAVLLGWLGRDINFSGIGLGEALLVDAIRKVAKSPIGAHAIFADAIDNRAATYYTDFGFIPLIERPFTLFLPIATAQRIFENDA